MELCGFFLVNLIFSSSSSSTIFVRSHEDLFVSATTKEPKVACLILFFNFRPSIHIFGFKTRNPKTQIFWVQPRPNPELKNLGLYAGSVVLSSRTEMGKTKPGPRSGFCHPYSSSLQICANLLQWHL